MRFNGRFALAFCGRLALMVTAIAALAWMIPMPGLYATKTLLGIVVLALL